MILFKTLCILSFGLTIWTFWCFIPYEFISFHKSMICLILGCVVINYFLVSYRRFFFDIRVDTESKAVLITGCDSGFGHQLARTLDDMGYQVFASCLFPGGSGAESLKNECSSRLQILGLDVTNEDSIKTAVNYVQTNLKDSQLWAVVNNAGIYKGFEISLTPIDDFRQCMEVNTLGVVSVTKAFLPMLLRSKGRVVVMTSITGYISFPHLAAYGMSKFAAVCFTETLRQEMRPWGVKVISIGPELFKTPLIDGSRLESAFLRICEVLDTAIKEAYGESYLVEYCKYVKKITGVMSSTQTNKVLNSLVDAVSLTNPQDVYKPCRNAFSRLIIYTMELLPKPVLDFAIYFFSYITLFPVPKRVKNKCE